jgi:methionine-rich copper-binding protein CopC
MPMSVYKIGPVVCALILFCAGPSGQTFAHAKLVSSTPAANATAMPPPTELRLKFSEAVEGKFTKVKVTGPDKTVIKTGPLKLDENDTVLIVPLASPLPDGGYEVEWQALAKDTHKTKGKFSFKSMH